MLNFSFGKNFDNYDDENEFTEEDYKLMYEIFKRDIEEDNLERQPKNELMNIIDEPYILTNNSNKIFDIENVNNYKTLSEFIKKKVELNCVKLNINKEMLLYDELKRKLNLSTNFDYPQLIVNFDEHLKSQNITNKNEQYNYIKNLLEFGRYFCLNDNNNSIKNDDPIQNYYQEDDHLIKSNYVDQYVVFYYDIKKFNRQLSKKSSKDTFDNCVNEMYKKLYLLKSKRINMMIQYHNHISKSNNNDFFDNISYNIENDNKEISTKKNTKIKSTKKSINNYDNRGLVDLLDDYILMDQYVNQDNENDIPNITKNIEKMNIEKDNTSNSNPFSESNNNNKLNNIKNDQNTNSINKTTIKLFNGRLKVIK